jgi:hypothetical protein
MQVKFANPAVRASRRRCLRRCLTCFGYDSRQQDIRTRRAELASTLVPVGGDRDICPSANESGPGEEGRIIGFAQSERSLPISRGGGTFVKHSRGAEIAQNEQAVAACKKR